MVDAIAAQAPASRVEVRPASVAFLTREVGPDLVPDLVAAVTTGPGALADISVKHGKDVIELTVTDATKGSALTLLREQLGADAVLFVGDDLTDEGAFTALHSGDVGVKVGPGATMADHRVPDVRTVAELLHALARLRADA
jgi:trehalose-phosphatase